MGSDGGADRPKLLLNEELALDLSAFEITHLPDTTEYGRLRKPEKYYVEASFTHEGYEISHKGNFGYQCRRNGEKIWEFRSQGYLYTDICFRADRVFFGTDYPMWDPEEELEKFLRLPLTSEEQEKILHLNFEKFLQELG
jgi:hypothetical protein